MKNSEGTQVAYYHYSNYSCLSTFCTTIPTYFFNFNRFFFILLCLYYNKFQFSKNGAPPTYTCHSISYTHKLYICVNVYAHVNTYWPQGQCCLLKGSKWGWMEGESSDCCQFSSSLTVKLCKSLSNLSGQIQRDPSSWQEHHDCQRWVCMHVLMNVW